jgi:hypothetical protein
MLFDAMEPLQVLRAKVAVNTPSLGTVGGFAYIKGEGLEKDVEEHSLTPLTLPCP